RIWDIWSKTALTSIRGLQYSIGRPGSQFRPLCPRSWPRRARLNLFSSSREALRLILSLPSTLDPNS
ncbi:unnamed protein product, partial [Mycena citricolor]